MKSAPRPSGREVPARPLGLTRRRAHAAPARFRRERVGRVGRAVTAFTLLVLALALAGGLAGGVAGAAAELWSAVQKARGT